MDSAHSKIPEKFFTLQETAEILAVTVDKLLEWNDNNILKPIITLNGKIGYTQEQINKFLEIQQAFLVNKVNKDDTNSPQPNQTFPINLDNTQQIDSKNLNSRESFFYSSPQNTSSPSDVNNKVIKSPKMANKNLSTFGLISSFSIITISLIVILLAQQNKYKPLTNYNNRSSQEKTTSLETTSTSQMNEISSIQSSIPAIQAQVKDKDSPEGNLNNTGTNSSENILTLPYSIYEQETSTNAAESNNQLTAVPPLEKGTGKNNLDVNEIVDISTLNYNYASRPNIIDNSRSANSSVLDKNGNIKGEASSTNLLSATLGTSGTIQNNKQLKQATGPNILFAFLIFALLSTIIVFRKQPLYSPVKINENLITSPSFVIDPEKQKVIEIGQKTNGTVVLYFQGDEYKISKPELNSESDQFIERLLGYASPDVKEIDYDIFKDKKIRLNAPLSKLVTRLGFVGLKRDLFFPRTSKNRVLFRRYLTQQDLTSMGLTSNQISNELIN